MATRSGDHRRPRPARRILSASSCPLPVAGWWPDVSATDAYGRLLVSAGAWQSANAGLDNLPYPAGIAGGHLISFARVDAFSYLSVLLFSRL